MEENEKLKSFEASIYEQWKSVMTASLFAAFLGVIGIFALIDCTIVFKVSIWVGFLVLFFTIIIAVYRAGKIEREEREKLLDGLEFQIIFDGNHPDYRVILHHQELLYRIGIREKKNRHVSGVTVSLEKIHEINPSGDEKFANQLSLLNHNHLHPKKLSFDRYEFALRGDAEYVDVIGENADKNSWLIPAVTHYEPELLKRLPIKEYKIIIKVEGEGKILPVRSEFVVGVDENMRMTLKKCD